MVIAISTRTGWSSAAIDAGRDLRKRRARATLGLGHIYSRRLEHRLAPVLGEYLAEELVARAADREHRLDVLQGPALDADVPGNDPHHLFVQLAAVHDPHRAKTQAFLTEVRRADLHRARHRPPDVGPVSLHGDETREASFPEDRRGHRHVVQVVAIARVRVVVDEDVALAERVEAAIGDRRLDREPEMALEHRQADALRDHLHVGIEDRAAEVEALADDVVVRGLDQADAHAMRGCVQRGADYFDRYRVWHV